MFLYILLAAPVLLLLARRLVTSRPPPGRAPVVATSKGKIEGELCFSSNGRVFSSFNGIPFAKPPVGKLRFLRPQTPDKWDGVKKCVHNKTCVQINLFKPGTPMEGREDGLYLNVNSPDLSPGKRMPVMVWIHGGGYTSGSASRQVYGFHHFMDKDVVMVSINYRLSVLGNLYLDRDLAPGNQALRDQIAGLQWVRDNIAQFGGDKDRVTIFGESAGGMSVMNLVLSPAAAGLFSAAITMSGSPLSPFVGVDKHPKYYADKLVEKMGGNPKDSLEDVLKLLQSKDAADFQHLTNMFEEFIRAPCPFKPIVDKDLCDDPVLPEEPLTLLKSGKYNKVPIIIGTNQNEGLLIKGFYERDVTKYDEAFDNWKTIGPLAFFHREKDEVSKEESDICMEYVKKNFGSTRFSSSGEGSRLLVQMYGDFMFTSPADNLCRLMVDTENPPAVYNYIYNHQGFFSLYDVLTVPGWRLLVKGVTMLLGLGWLKSSDGVCHADELMLMFKGTILPDTAVTEEDRRVRRSLVDMWTEFATSHAPTKDGSWARFDSCNPQYLEIGSERNVMKYPDSHRERMAEWKEIYDKIPCTMRHQASRSWVDQ